MTPGHSHITPPSHLHINLKTLAQNARWWRKLITHPNANTRLGAVVKANAYGLGAVPVARTLLDAGADLLLLYTLDEALELLTADINAPMIVFLPTRNIPDLPTIHNAIAAGNLQFSADDLPQLKSLAKWAQKQNTTLQLHLHIDTGMSRAGFSPDQTPQALDFFNKSPHLTLAGIYSHHATAPSDPQFVAEQTDRLDNILKQNKHAIPPDTPIHLASTFSTARNHRYHRALVRVGLGLYGYGPNQLPKDQRIQTDTLPNPALRWLSHITHIQNYPPDATVSYDRTFKLTRPSRLAIVPVGYGAGYPCALANKASLRILDSDHNPIATCPLRGAVNMDQIVIDLTDAPTDITPGQTVEIIANDLNAPNSPPNLARLANTHTYEILCRLSPRLPRIYTNANTPQKTASPTHTNTPPAQNHAN